MSDQKYRQRGYKDGEKKEERRGDRPSILREAPTGPRGRGLGKPTATVFRCAACGFKQSLEAATQLDATCVKCKADLHTCSHCLFFDSGLPRECRKPIEVRIKVKTKRNECVLFAARTTQEQEVEVAGVRDARSAFDALFK
jgi:hypothetical protein